MAHCREGRAQLSASSSAGSKTMRKKKEKIKSMKTLSRFWSWGPLRAISRILLHRFPCVFSIFVQAIHYLPPSLENLRLVVECMHKDQLWQTKASTVIRGVAKFEQAIRIQTTINGRRVSSDGVFGLRFLPEELRFSIFVLDTGRRFLLDQKINLCPPTLNDPQQPKELVGATVRFLLSGEAEGAILVVTIDSDMVIKLAKASHNGSSSPRFSGSPLQTALAATKSPTCSRSDSANVRRPICHCTSRCSSFNSGHCLHIESLDLNCSPDEKARGLLLEGNCSSDEERIKALLNDPLSLDDCFDRGHPTQTLWQASKPGSVAYKYDPVLWCAINVWHHAKQASAEEGFGFAVNCKRKDELRSVNYGIIDNMVLKTIDIQKINQEKVNNHCGCSAAPGHHYDAKTPKDVNKGKASAEYLWQTVSVEKYELPKHTLSSVGNDQNAFLTPEGVGYGLFVNHGKVNQSQSVKTLQDANLRCFMKEPSVKHVTYLQTHDDYAKGMLGMLLKPQKEIESRVDTCEGLCESSVDSMCKGSDMHKQPQFSSGRDHDILSLEADIIMNDFLYILEGGYRTSQSRVVEKLFLQDDQACLRQSEASPVSKGRATTCVNEPGGPMCLLWMIRAGEMEMKKADQAARSKARAKILEDMETRALMMQWGITDKAFELSSPRPRSPKLPGRMCVALGTKEILGMRLFQL